MKSNNTLYIFVHGIGSNKNTWDQFLDVMLNDYDQLMSEELYDSSQMNKTYYTYFEYDAPIVTNILKNNSVSKWFQKNISGSIPKGDITIPQYARIFKTFMDSKSHFDNICVLAHSMGGIIALQAMVRLDLDISKLVLFATPISGSNNSNEIKAFFNEKSWYRGALFSYIVRELSTDSNTLRTLKKDIITKKDELLSKDILFLFAESDSRIVHTSKEFAEIFTNNVESFDEDHSSIKEPKNIDSLPYIFTKNFLKTKPLHISKEEESLLKLREDWQEKTSVEKQDFPFIVPKSINTTTIYENNTVIDYFKYSIEMMQDGRVSFEHAFKPFDTKVAEKVEEDEIYINYSKNRFSKKSCKICYTPVETPIEGTFILTMDGL